MSTILAIVQAEREGKIESKLIKARQMEEIREARKAELEKKEADRKAKFDETKESLRKKRRRKHNGEEEDEPPAAPAQERLGKDGKRKKRVSFA
jgi:60S ribosomal subunit assembly/export protein LOC1